MQKILIIAAVIIGCAFAGALNGAKYTNVGGTGQYNQVVDMPAGVWPACTLGEGKCVRRPKQVSGKLAPFNEELSIVLRGPMNVYNIAVYQPGTSGRNNAWRLVSSYKANQTPKNMVFLNNKGDPQKSGTWSVCHGNSQSFASPDFKSAANSATPGNFPGHIPADQEFNIMTGAPCTAGNPCEGFSRGTAYHGWANSKMFFFEIDMPMAGDAVPAIWALNAQILRTAQYGCNCRGMGEEGGCGELDILEVVDPAEIYKAITQIYSFKGSIGGGSNYYFDRPYNRGTYVAVFDVNSDSIAIQKLNGFDWNAKSIPQSVVDGYLSPNGKHVINFPKLI